MGEKTLIEDCCQRTAYLKLFFDNSATSGFKIFISLEGIENPILRLGIKFLDISEVWTTKILNLAPVCCKHLDILQ